MGYQLTPAVFVHGLILLMTVALVGYILTQYRRERHRTELLAFTVYMFTMGLWQLVSLFRDVVTAADLKVLATVLINGAVGPIYVYAFVWFVLAYTGNDEWVNRWSVAAALGSVGLLSLAYVVDPGLLLQFGPLRTLGPVSVLTLTFEPWVVIERSRTPIFLLFQLVFIALAAFATVVLARYLLANRDDVSVGQVVWLVLGLTVANVAYALVFVGVLPLSRGITDLAVGVTGAAFAVAVLRYRLLRVAPVGRRQVVERMADPVVLVDDSGRVVDANRAARNLVDADPEWRGSPVTAFFSPFPEPVRDVASLPPEVSVGVDGETRHFDLDTAPIVARGTDIGHVVVLREVTELKDREQELDLMRQVQSRVLRHNIRNELQTVQLYGEQLAATTDPDDAELAEGIVTTAQELLSVSDKTRAAEQLVDGDQSPTRINLAAVLGAIADDVRCSFPEVSLQLSCPDEVLVETIPAIEFALRNLVENAAEHNDGPTRSVEVTVSRSDSDVVVTVSDDGPGIPEQELRVLSSGGESPLVHSSGVGLWVVQWVVDACGATVTYDTDGDGTDATLRIPASD